MQAFLNAYYEACSEVGATPSPGVLSSSSGVLHVRGSIGKMREQRLCDDDMPPLAGALQTGHAFEEVDLSYNELGSKGLRSLLALLQTDAVVRKLNLSYNRIDADGVEELCAVLRENTSLEELSLSGNQLGNRGGLAVAQLLQGDGAIKRLHLSNCELDDLSLIYLATVLRENETLRSLDVSRSLLAPLMEEEASHIGRMLKVNSTLVDLDLSRCGIHDLGLQARGRRGRREGCEIERMGGGRGRCGEKGRGG